MSLLSSLASMNPRRDDASQPLASAAFASPPARGSWEEETTSEEDRERPGFPRSSSSVRRHQLASSRPRVLACRQAPSGPRRQINQPFGLPFPRKQGERAGVPSQVEKARLALLGAESDVIVLIMGESCPLLERQEEGRSGESGPTVVSLCPNKRRMALSRCLFVRIACRKRKARFLFPQRLLGSVNVLRWDTKLGNQLF